MSQPIFPANNLKRALKSGQSVIGTMLIEIRQPSVMQLLANAGFQFVIIDNEHGPFTIESIADLSRAARSSGLTPIVRPTEVTYSHITQPLDAGAQGLMIPRVAGAEQVRTVLQMMKYPPPGRRGVVSGRGHTNFHPIAPSSVMAASNEETMLIVQVEMKETLENLNEILSVPGVDVALVGPTDLSVALGVPGAMDSPKLTAAIEMTLEGCRKHAVVPAIHMNDLSQGVLWAGKGMRMISMNSEAGLLMKAGKEATDAVVKAFRS